MRSSPINPGYSIINGSGSGPNGGRIDVWIEYTYTQEEANNRSYVTAYFYAELNPSYASSTWGSSGCYSAFNVDGASGSNLKSNGSYDFRSSSTLNLLGSYSGYIAHNADGTKSISMTGSFSTSSSYITGGNVGGTMPLTTIPRASSVSVGNGKMGDSIHISISRASTSFTHTIGYSFYGSSNDIFYNVTEGCDWTPDKSLANQIPNSASGQCTIYCNTYSGGTYIGSKSTTFILSVSDDAFPTATGLSAEKSNENITVAGWNKLVRGYSKILLTGSATGSYYSTISAYNYVIKKSGVSIFTASLAGAWTSPILTEAGTYIASVTAVDSRGRTSGAYESEQFIVVDYSMPVISGETAFRWDNENSEQSRIGKSIKAFAAGSYSSLGGSNSAEMTLEYRVSGGTYSTVQSNFDEVVIGNDELSLTSAYEVRFTIEDALNTVSKSILVKTAQVTLHLKNGGNGLGIGGAVDAGVEEFQVYIPTQFKDKVGIGGAADADEFQCYMPAVFKNTLNCSGMRPATAGNYGRTDFYNDSFGNVNCAKYFTYRDEANGIYSGITQDYDGTSYSLGVVCVSSNGQGRIRFHTAAGACIADFQANMNVWFASNVSADSFTDRTPFYEGDALAEIMKISGVNGEIDHNTLPEFVRRRLPAGNDVASTENAGIPVSDADKTTSADKEETDVDQTGTKMEDGRDIGALVTMLTVAIQQLNRKLDTAETKIAEMENRIESLEPKIE